MSAQNNSKHYVVLGLALDESKPLNPRMQISLILSIVLFLFGSLMLVLAVCTLVRHKKGWRMRQMQRYVRIGGAKHFEGWEKSLISNTHAPMSPEVILKYVK